MGGLFTHLEVVITVLVTVITALLILQDRRTPQSALAWILFLILLPYLAVPAFLALGYRKRRLSERQIAFGDPAPQTIALAEAWPIDRLLRRYGQPGAVAGNRFAFGFVPEPAYAELIALVEGAERSVDVTLYALGNDPVGRAFVVALARRARAGVRVRVILDGLGAINRPRRALRRLQQAGGEVRFYARVLHGPFGARINLRNHRKMVIVDDGVVIAGGRNVGQEYFGPQPRQGRWADLSFTLEGPAVATYVAVFRADWKAAGGQNTPVVGPRPDPTADAGSARLQVVASGPDVDDDALHDALVWACHGALRRIWIVTPYFLPTAALVDALAIAARRGVDLRILVPARSNQRLADLARGAYLRELQGRGASVLLYAPGMVHAKAFVIDDLAVVGSANLDVRSLLLNYEVSVLLQSPADVAEVADWMEGLFADARPLPVDVSRMRRFVERLFRLGAPIL